MGLIGGYPEATAVTSDDRLLGIDGSSTKRFTPNDVGKYVAGRLGVFNVLDYGAVGDGVTDDTTAIQAAITAAAASASGSATLLFPGGKTYKLASGLTFDIRGCRLHVEAHGARISYTGSGSMWTITSPSQANTWRRLFFTGGEWVGTASAVDAFRLHDVRGSHWSEVVVDGFSAGAAWHLLNDYAWSELNTFVDCTAINVKHAINFDPQSVNLSGNGGTESFARTYVARLRIGGTASSCVYLNCRGGVYDSDFHAIGGNITDGQVVFNLQGTMGGTTIRHVGVENTSGAGTGTMFQWGTFSGNAPALVGQFVVRNSITKNSGTVVYNPLEVARLAVEDTLTVGDSTVSSTGRIRISNNQAIRARNAAGTDDVEIARIDATNKLVLGAFKNAAGVSTANIPHGFYGATPVAKPTVTGSRGGNAALASLLTQLASVGLITDSTSA